MKPHAEILFKTDTATLAIFDPFCLAHRINEPCDWWSIPDDEICEVNKGNVIFAGLGSDGTYKVGIHIHRDGDQFPSFRTRCNLRVQNGSAYIGAGEQVVGEGFGPCTIYGGVLFSLEAGTYEVGLNLDANTNYIDVYFRRIDGGHSNDIAEGIHLCP